MSYLVYIADDDLQLGRYLEKVATMCGWSASHCRDGLELVTALEMEKHPALALVDVQMPRMDGIEVISALLTFKHRLRLRFMSGGHIVDTLAAHMIANGREMSVGATIHKPMRLEELMSIFEREKAELDKLEVAH